MRKQELLKLIQDQQAEIDLLKHRLSILELSSRPVYQPPTDKPWRASPYKITMTSDTEGILTTKDLEGNEVLSYDKMPEGLDNPQSSTKSPVIRNIEGNTFDASSFIKRKEEINKSSQSYPLGHLGELPPGRQRNIIRRDDIQLGVDRDH